MTLARDKKTTSIQVDNSKNLEIPKQLWLIWYGSVLRNTSIHPYVNRLKEWMELNPDYKVFLVSDSDSMEPEEFLKMQTLCDDESINLKNLQDDEFSNLDLLTFIKNEIKHKMWGLASDITRMALLYKFGGIYVDCDIPPICLKTIHAPLGVSFANYYFELQASWLNSIDFMISSPGHFLFKILLTYVATVINVVDSKEENKIWRESSSKAMVNKATMLLTGCSLSIVNKKAMQLVDLRHAMNFPTMSGKTGKVDSTWLDNTTDFHDDSAEQAFAKFQNSLLWVFEISKETFGTMITSQFRELIKKTSWTSKFNSNFSFFSHPEAQIYKRVSKGYLEIINEVENQVCCQYLEEGVQVTSSYRPK